MWQIFKRLKKRYRSLPDDVKRLLVSLVEDPEQGVELYNGMRKVRINFTSKVYIYDKSDMDNVSDEFLDQVIIDVGQGKYTSLAVETIQE